jgi:O-antigen/teichoic acid export membrane protein
MLRQRDIILTVLIQGIGALATMTVTAVVAARFGPEGQGFWASFKSVLDLASVVAAYGFPAGFPFLINVRRVSDLRLLRFSLVYGLILIPGVWVAITIAASLGLMHLASPTPRLEVGLLAAASAALAVQSMIRGLSLATTSTEIFNVITALPAAMLLLTIAVWPVGQETMLMSVAVTSAFVSVVACLALWLKYRRQQPDAAEKTPYAELFSFGGWNFVVSVTMAAIPASTFQILTAHGVERREIGWLSLAILVQGALLTPANMVGPVLYNAWTRVDDAEARRESFAHLHRMAFVWSIVASAAAAVVLAFARPWLATRDFAAVVPLAWILLAAVPFGYSSRLMANVLLASGAARSYAVATAARLGAIIAVLLLAGTPSTRTAAIAWVVGEASALVVSAAIIVASLHWSWPDALGLRANRGPA